MSVNRITILIDFILLVAFLVLSIKFFSISYNKAFDYAYTWDTETTQEIEQNEDDKTKTN